MTTPNPDSNAILALARETLDIEIAALRDMAGRLDQQFVRAVAVMLQCRGRIVVSGMGKSGHVGRKIAATLASTGSPAFFMHPGEAAHGDLGMITGDDVWLAMSNSGESDELMALVPSIKRRGVPFIAMTGNPASSLGREADIHLDSGVAREACPLNLAPTASTTAQLALGDALAVALLNQRGFSKDDFALTHPGGSLGRKLLVHVRDLMHSGDDLPVVSEHTLLREALLEITDKRLGMTAVVDAEHILLGVFTDGDLRRALDCGTDIMTTPVGEVMSRNPRRIHPDKLAAEAVHLMQTHRIFGLLVAGDDGRLVGALNMHDLLRAGVV
ncbi:MAG: hypothetical protein RL210_2455 [Pseudomonadota bacterium]